jgi:signal transduction histidine kinase
MFAHGHEPFVDSQADLRQNHIVWPLFGRSLYLGPGLAWLVNLRWLACCGLLFVIWLSSSGLELLTDPAPLYWAASFLALYNLLLHLFHDRLAALGSGKIEGVLFAQISLDLCMLTWLLYHAGIAHNPFVYYYIFHIIIAGILLPARYAWIEATLASALAGGVMVLQQAGVIPEHPLAIPAPWPDTPLILAGKIIALCTTLYFAAYFTHAVLGQVRRAESEIRQQDKLLDLGRLVSGIVHQIKNPLDGLKNCLHFLSRGEKDGDCSRYVGLMDEELDRIEQLTERLQGYAAPRPVDIERVDVNARIREAIHLLEISRGRQVSVNLSMGEIPAARADSFAVQEIILNLCRNALDAMPEGGTLKVCSYVVHHGTSRMVQIDVIDTGPGISGRDKERVFDAFYTTKPSQEGSGLGLWICRTLAVQMGAALKLESTPGRGSTFSLVLPVETSV